MSGLFSISPNSVAFSTGGTQNSKISSSTPDEITVEGSAPSSRAIIEGVDTPASDFQAANKKYVDDNSGGGGGIPDGSVTTVKLADGAVTAQKVDTSEVLVTTSVVQSRAGALSITDPTQSTSAGNGCLVLSGGLGIAMDVNCDGTMSAVQHITTSDARLKHNLAELRDPGEMLSRVKVYSYNLATDAGPLKYGVVAQDLLEQRGLAESVVQTGGRSGDDDDEDGDNFYAVDYNNFVALLIGTVQDLTKRVEDLESAGVK